jgi:hypothetical protein
VNAKIYKENLALFKQTIKHLEGGHGRLTLGDVYTCHGFFPRMRLKKPIPEYLFTSLLKDLSTEDLVTLATSYQYNLWNPIDESIQLQASKHGCQKF